MRDTSASSLRAARFIYTISTLFFAVNTWRPVPRSGYPIFPVRKHKEYLGRVLEAGAPRHAPCLENHPSTALLPEAGLPALFPFLTKRHVIRLHRLDSTHPLVSRFRSTSADVLSCTHLIWDLELLPMLVPALPTLLFHGAVAAYGLYVRQYRRSTRCARMQADL